ncbi:MAG: hypothetical protein U0790_00865 [Isosphaeraceae bacterium]
MKTEFTLVQLDCTDSRGERRLVHLLVWLFGIRRLVRDEAYPDTSEDEWPEPCMVGEPEDGRPSPETPPPP